MDDKDFNRLADEMLGRIEAALEASDADLDFELALVACWKSSLSTIARSSSIDMLSPRKSGLRPGQVASISAGMVPPGATREITPNCLPSCRRSPASRPANPLI